MIKINRGITMSIIKGGGAIAITTTKRMKAMPTLFKGYLDQYGSINIDGFHDAYEKRNLETRKRYVDGITRMEGVKIIERRKAV